MSQTTAPAAPAATASPTTATTPITPGAPVDPPRYLGRTASASISAAELDLWPAPAVDEVSFSTSELQAVCPVTSQPDVYAATITYVAGEFVVESKALKLYLTSFRDAAVSAEALAARIADDLEQVLAPRSLTVHLVQNVRGGLTLSVRASRGER